MYTKEAVKHFLCPENVGVIEDADAIGEAGSDGCGDYLCLYIKVNNDEVIEDIKFKVYGCCGAIATSSMTTVLAKGKTIDEAFNIKEDDIITALGGLPENKQHCSLLGVDALRDAINKYRSKKIQNN